MQILLQFLLIQIKQVAPGDAIALKWAAIPDAYLRQQLHCLCH